MTTMAIDDDSDAYYASFAFDARVRLAIAGEFNSRQKTMSKCFQVIVYLTVVVISMQTVSLRVGCFAFEMGENR